MKKIKFLVVSFLFCAMSCVVILLLIVLAACQSNKLVELNLEQVHRETLKSDSLGMSGKMKAPRKVFVVGDYLALLEDKDKQGFLHFYDMDGKFVSKYGIIGRAAQEFFIPNVFPDADSLIGCRWTVNIQIYIARALR